MQPEPDITDRRSRRNDADDPREAEAPGAQDLPARIVNAAIAIGEERGRWSAVRLHDVAGRLGVPTSQVLDHFPDLDSVADAWFMRALKAMVGQKPPEFLELPEWRRIELCFNGWFDALAPHRRMTAQMLRGKQALLVGCWRQNAGGGFPCASQHRFSYDRSWIVPRPLTVRPAVRVSEVSPALAEKASMHDDRQHRLRRARGLRREVTPSRVRCTRP